MTYNDYWKSWGEIKSTASGRKFVFFGRSEDWVPKAMKKISRFVAMPNTMNIHDIINV